MIGLLRARGGIPVKQVQPLLGTCRVWIIIRDLPLPLRRPPQYSRPPFSDNSGSPVSLVVGAGPPWDFVFDKNCTHFLGPSNIQGDCGRLALGELHELCRLGGFARKGPKAVRMQLNENVNVTWPIPWRHRKASQGAAIAREPTPWIFRAIFLWRRGNVVPRVAFTWPFVAGKGKVKEQTQRWGPGVKAHRGDYRASPV